MEYYSKKWSTESLSYYAINEELDKCWIIEVFGSSYTIEIVSLDRGTLDLGWLASVRSTFTKETKKVWEQAKKDCITFVKVMGETNNGD